MDRRKTVAAFRERLREVIERQDRDQHREPHGAFGRLSREQWEQLHRRHAELHLSFLESEE